MLSSSSSKKDIFLQVYTERYAIHKFLHSTRVLIAESQDGLKETGISCSPTISDTKFINVLGTYKMECETQQNIFGDVSPPKLTAEINDGFAIIRDNLNEVVCQNDLTRCDAGINPNYIPKIVKCKNVFVSMPK